MIPMYKIGVIGGPDTVIGFKALGLDTFPVRGADEARTVFKKITRPEEDFAILYIEEGLAQALAADIDKFKDSPRPAVILIPGKDGSLGLGQSALQAAVERAVGVNIL